MIQRTEAIILKTQNWSESSRIVHAFTRNFGRMKFMAKGVRRSKSKFGAAFDPGTLSQVVFYRSLRSELHTASEASVVFYPGQGLKVTDTLNFLAPALEVAYRATDLESPNLALFNNLSVLLKALEHSPSPQRPLAEFCLASIKNLGYHPVLNRCLDCKKLVCDELFLFSLSLGGLLCPGCGKKHGESVALTSPVLKGLDFWQQHDYLPPLDPEDSLFLIRLLAEFINHHLSGHSRLVSFKYLPRA
ncbi:DNA repair protein RecO [candidate division TA06 bacterium]|uniref:DNA repair protein RecO n=1 Tax=candidate division TA06 bacterium TaxID=2250710 RepID=A0A933IAZ1_UNCT6|nr:DNA repair protein RecO [candidate division TA06 bacterium]